MRLLRYLLAAALSLAPLPNVNAGWLPLAGPGGGGGPCSAYTTWLAATSGTSGTEQSVAQTLICGLVSDGVWAQLDFFYWFPTNTTATAVINMKNPGTFNLSVTNAGTFTADTGWAGNGTTTIGDTGYTPSSSGSITLNNVSAGVYITVGPDGGTDLGTDDAAGGNNDIVVQPGSAGSGIGGLNSNGFFEGIATVVGDWVSTRNGASAATQVIVERNGSAIAGSPYTNSSTSIPNQTITLWSNHGGAGSHNNFTANTLISAWVGQTLSGAQRTALHSRLNTACVAMGIGTC